MSLNELKQQSDHKPVISVNIVLEPKLKTRYRDSSVPLERQATFLHSRLGAYLQDLQSMDEAIMARYKRLALHLIKNKVDPLRLDELKYSLLHNADSEYVSVTATTLRQLVR